MEKIERPLLKLTGNEHKHLAEVLRARAGDKIILCPNDGRDYIYEIRSFDKTSATLSYVNDCENNTEPELYLAVFPSLLKGDKTEFEVQKLTELGVKKISPFIGDYTVQKSEKSERLRRAAHEASKQCGRAVIPTVDDPIRFSDIIPALGEYDVVVFAYEGAYARGKRLGDVIKKSARRIALVVGPEGGFSEAEVKMMSECGYCPVTLGKRILRAETAAIAGAAVIMQLAGEWE